MATACVVLVATANAGAAGLVEAMREAMAGATKSTTIFAAARSGLEIALLTLSLPVGALLGVACLAGLAQTRGLATALPLLPEGRKVLPTLGRVVGRDRAMEAGKGCLALGILLAVGFWSIRPAISCIAALGGASAARILRAVGVLGEYLAIRLTVAMLALGAADFLWRHHRHRKALRMSRDEVKREHKESEGEPSHKAERLRLHQEGMQEQASGDVAEADFVVVESGVMVGVMAAAIRYDREARGAPVVMVKGEHRHAQAIEAAARAAGIPVLIHPGLVRALASVDDGCEIPPALYEQVAECLVRVQAMGQAEN
jgi:flagellar biosynthesis protein FlhB